MQLDWGVQSAGRRRFRQQGNQVLGCEPKQAAGVMWIASQIASLSE